ncbi:MAG: hypothetical protein B6I38_08705 [Anaerolineaceae bacterium 4572_5.1]|nr:MAG: hypothetical protein B5M51_07725 [Anaerolinea sp. 4484_236]OQY28916.1 MAG: hypothetical protein B6I38_08705 [Anaerolineaceae bacterium 4572_5.1]
MSLPIIGITSSHSKNRHGLPIVHLLRTYVDATINAGGVPVIIPSELPEESWKLLYAKLDGIIFSGGSDIDPALFNGESHPAVQGIDSERDTLELSLMRYMIEDEKPFLAICRGFQVLNVALGGTLYTHISDQVANSLQHDTPKDQPRGSHAHEIQVRENSRLAEILGKPILKVNSWHHQGVKDIPPQLKISAHSPDGLVEGLELPNHPFGIAVQWHPEWMPEDTAMKALFKAFVNAAKN